MTKETRFFIYALFTDYAQSSSGNEKALRRAWSELERDNALWTVSTVAREDLLERGFDPADLTDDDMRALADDMGEALNDSGAYWDALNAVLDSFPVKKLAD